MIVLSLDAATAACLAQAIRAYRRVYAKAGQTVPAALVEVERAARERAHGREAGQTRTDPDISDLGGPSHSYGGPDGDALLTFQQVAVELGKSPRTVRRWVDCGHLRSVPVGTRRYIRRSELLERLDPDRGTE